MPSEYDLLLEPDTAKPGNEYDALLSSESNSPYDELLKADAPVAGSNQPTPTALPGPGNDPGPAGQSPDLRGALSSLFKMPARAVMTMTNTLAGSLTPEFWAASGPNPYVPTDQDLETPLVSGETMGTILKMPIVGAAQGRFNQETGGLAGALRGILEGTGDALSSFTTPESLALLPIGGGGKAAQRVLAGVFEGQAILGTPEQWDALKKAETTADKVRIATAMGLGLAIPAAAFAHTFKGKGIEMTPELSEAGSKAAGEPPATIETQPTVPVESLPKTVGSRIEGPALVDPDGNVIIQGKIGETHADLMKRAMAGADVEKAIAAFENDAQHVFLDDQGTVLSREQAAPIGVSSGQLPEGTTKVESEMLKAEQEAGTRTNSFQIPHEPLGVPDIVDVLVENGGVKSRTADNADLWNDQPDLRGVYRQLLGGKQAPDQMAAIAAEAGFGDGSVSSFWQEVDKAVQSRRSLRTQSIEQGKQQVAANAKDKSFSQDVLAPDETRQQINTSNMQVGDEMTVAGEKFKVTDIDPDTLDVTLEDGKKYGVQQLKDGQAVYVDAADMVPREQDIFAPEEVMSPGPGAASAKEKLASYELRRFGARFQEDQNIDLAIREQTGNRYYEPISNKVTVADAEAIIESRGTDESIRLVRDEDFQMQPRVRVTMGEALIKKLNQSYQEAVAAGDVRATEFLEQAVDTAEYLSGYGTTLGQGVQAFAIWNKLSPEGRLLEATRITKKAGIELTPEQQKKIGELNAEIEKAPEGFQKTEKTQDLMSYMAEIKGINPADVPTALWYSNILSGFTTQLVNTIDTAMNVLAESVAMAASHPAAVPEIISGLYQGMIKGGFEAASVLKTGRSAGSDKIQQQRILERVKFGKEGGVPINTDTALGRFLRTTFESKPATVLNLWKYPLRAMIASDTVFFNSMKEARARFLARGIAKTEGLSGDALFRRVQETLNQSPEMLDAALKQAQDEGLTGLQQRRRVAEIVEQGRADDLVDAATEAAQIATYNHDPSGVLGLVAQNIGNITESFPLGKAVVPFTRIVANVANRGLNYTPWGYKRLFFGEWGGKNFATEPPTGDAFRSQLVKATLGTTAMTAVALLDANNTIQVTAKGPDDVNDMRQLQNTGWKPYSVKVGDTYYSYQYTPFNLGFAMVGHYRDAVRYNKLGEKDAATRLAYGMLKSGSTIFDMSFLTNVSDFMSAVQGESGSTKGISRLLSRTASSVVIPNLVKQIDKLFDPTVYQADTITQSLIRETPIARGAALKPMLNILGEPIKPSSNRFFTFDTNDPVWKLIVEKQAWIPVPSKMTKIRDRPIAQDEYYRLIEESGPMIREYLQDNLGRLREMSGEAAQEDVQKESKRIRNTVKSRF